MPLKRYIRVPGITPEQSTVLDRENICAIFWSEKDAGRLHVQLTGGQEHFFDGDDAVMVDEWYYPKVVEPGNWREE